MGFLYRRRDSRLWWVCWTDITGERRRESTGLTDLEPARKVLEGLEARVSVKRKLALAAVQTVADYARSRAEAGALLSCLSPELASSPLCDVRHQQVMEWMQALPELRPADAPPARALFMQLHRLFDDAVADGLVASNPCRSEREAAADAGVDLDRRLSNHFTRAELERLLSDPRLDRFRRCQWAVLALTGARIGELLGLRVRHVDLGRQPLGRLLVTGRWDSKLRRLTPPRSGLPREVPVHRTLAAMLQEHLRASLPIRLGRAADPDDLLFPAADGSPQQAGTTLAHLQRDLEAVGLRKGNLHTLRRTFFSLGRQDGAAAQVLRLISEEPRTGDPDVPYAARCAEIARLDVQVGRGGGGGGPVTPAGPLAPPRHARKLGR
ncbi:MAG TPA: site-specific integrase [Myxococcaceae bacterium]|nr:site-specific integrase [Myxococcaceae bacterium]